MEDIIIGDAITQQMVSKLLKIVISILIALNFITVHCFAEETRVDMELPYGVSGEFKTYMDHRCITDETSLQWELQQESVTDGDGFRRYNDLYMIALGTYYTEETGKEFEIELSSGVVIECISGDIRSDVDSDKTGKYNPINNGIIEFIVNTDVMNEETILLGDVSCEGFEGEIIRITKLE